MASISEAIWNSLPVTFGLDTNILLFLLTQFLIIGFFLLTCLLNTEKKWRSLIIYEKLIISFVFGTIMTFSFGFICIGFIFLKLLPNNNFSYFIFNIIFAGLYLIYKKGFENIYEEIIKYLKNIFNIETKPTHNNYKSDIIKKEFYYAFNFLNLSLIIMFLLVFVQILLQNYNTYIHITLDILSKIFSILIKIIPNPI